MTSMKFFRIILALLGGTHVLYAQSSAIPTVKSIGEYNFPYNVADYYCLENYPSFWINLADISWHRWKYCEAVENAQIYTFISDDFCVRYTVSTRYISRDVADQAGK